MDNSKASRVEEVTIDPYNVVGKWATEDWPIASQSVDASAREGLREWHQRFQTDRWACGLSGLSVAHRLEGNREQLLAVAACERGDDRAASAYVVFAGGQRGFRIVSISSNKPALPEDSGYMVWRAGGPGLTDPVLEHSVRPKLPAGAVPTGTTPVSIPFGIIVKEDGSIDPAVRVRSWPLSQDRIVVQAIKAVRQWKYKPGLKDGRPVRVSLDVDVAFE